MPNEPQFATVQTNVPTRLLAEMQSLVDAGWFGSLDEVMLDALRRFLDSQRMWNGACVGRTDPRSRL
jgi:Arc/MetJ-type ribon-helix-helix transcriptional regulator